MDSILLLPYGPLKRDLALVIKVPMYQRQQRVPLFDRGCLQATGHMPHQSGSDTHTLMDVGAEGAFCLSWNPSKPQDAG